MPPVSSWYTNQLPLRPSLGQKLLVVSSRSSINSGSLQSRKLLPPLPAPPVTVVCVLLAVPALPPLLVVFDALAALPPLPLAPLLVVSPLVSALAELPAEPPVAALLPPLPLLALTPSLPLLALAPPLPLSVSLVSRRSSTEHALRVKHSATEQWKELACCSLAGESCVSACAGYPGARRLRIRARA